VVVFVTGTPIEKTIRVLSHSLSAAGGAVVSPDGKRIVFAGKAQAKDDWQIYEAPPNGWELKRLTSRPGGCMDPALLPDGSLLFVSPVQKVVGTCVSCEPSLYVQHRGAPLQQLTFGNMGVFSPTVLADGRILFVGATPSPIPNGPPKQALYTINSDGTEISAFAGQHEKLITIQRPRELEDGRIVFLANTAPKAQPDSPEFVLSAAPFRGRKPLFGHAVRGRSVEPALNGDLLVCAPVGEPADDSCRHWALFRTKSEAASFGAPLMDNPEWDQIEAVPATAIRRPMGRLSNVDPSKNTGQILCLNANFTSYGSSLHSHEFRATRIRVFTEISRDERAELGEIELQADGSFMAEVPANVPLGFEALDEQGNIIRRDPALIWVRPGENRSCNGCHEPHNQAPRNSRPLAVRLPVPRLQSNTPAALADNQH
jgi:hypothetical protein